MNGLQIFIEIGHDYGPMSWSEANLTVAGLQAEKLQNTLEVWRFPSVSELKFFSKAELLPIKNWYWTDEGAWLTEPEQVDQVKAVCVSECEDTRVDINASNVNLIVVRSHDDAKHITAP